MAQQHRNHSVGFGVLESEHVVEIAALNLPFNFFQISKNATCSVEERECESSVSFPEEQEKYCITPSGWIRQTRVQETGPYCYSGTLNPGENSD